MCLVSICTTCYTELEELLKEYQSQFTHDKTTIVTTLLTYMPIDTRAFEPVSLKPYPLAMKHYKWVKDTINKLLTAKVIKESQPIWSAPIILVPKGDGGKCLVIDYCALNKITQKFIWTMSNTCIFPGPNDRFPKRLSFCHCLPGWYNHLQQNGRGSPGPHQESFWKITKC